MKSDYLTNEQERKSDFVRKLLSPMLYEATRHCVREAWYEVDLVYGSECVVYAWMSKPGGECRFVEVNVTGDSFWAIAKDVMKSVARLLD